MPEYDGEIVSGELPRKNVRLEATKAALKFTPSKFQVFQIGNRTFLEVTAFKEVIDQIKAKQRSDYYDLFRAGAAIYPRQFWFVDVIVSPRVGINPRMPSVKSSQRSLDRAKENYVGVQLKGQVESQFLFQATTGSELVPFGHLSLPLVVLPIEPTASKNADKETGGYKGTYRIIDSSEAKKRGYSRLQDWLMQVERVWRSKRGEKADRLSVYQWLDYTGKLTRQSPKAKYRVLYNSSGTFLVSCVVKNGAFDVKVDDSAVKSQGVISEITTFHWDTDNETEAHYVAGFLNAPIVDRLIKPMQARGDWGERHIHKKVLELPIPKYDVGNELHKKLSALAKSSETKVSHILPPLAEKYDGIGKIRQVVKQELEVEITQIDQLVKKILLTRRGARRLDQLLNA